MNEGPSVTVTLKLPQQRAEAFARFLEVAGVSCFDFWGARNIEEAEQMKEAARIMRAAFAAHGIRAGEGRT